MNIIDTHCHYNLSPLYENWQEHWQKAQAHGVVQSLIPSASIETSRRAIEIAAQDKNLWAAIGVHPHEYNQVSAADLPTLLTQHAATLAMMIDNENVIAIGETGLDYYRLPQDQRDTAINNQRQALRMHIHLANEFNKILIIHARDIGGDNKEDNQAYWDILDLIKSDYQFKRPFILHCVSGPKAYVSAALELGAYVGVVANVTYKNATALRELVAQVPTDKLLVETDAPYLPPQEFRGQICEPWMIKETAEYLKNNFQINNFYLNFIGLK